MTFEYVLGAVLMIIGAGAVSFGFIYFILWLGCICDGRAW